MECIAKKHAERCINKLWSEIDTNIQNYLVEIINEDYEDWNTNEGIITFGDMPFEIEARIIPDGRELVARPYKVSRMKLNGDLEEYYYKVINSINDDNYDELEEYTFIGIKLLLKFLIDNLQAEPLMCLCENTKEQLEWYLCDIIDSVKKGNNEYFELNAFNTYNCKKAKINITVEDNKIIF